MRHDSLDVFYYLPTSERDRQWGLYVVGAGYQNVNSGDEYPPPHHPSSHYFAWQRGRVLDEFQAIFLISGEGIFESKPTGDRIIKAGDVFFLFPGIWHRYTPSKASGWKQYWVSFKGEHADRLLRSGFLDPENAIVGTGLDDRILSPFNRVLNRIRTQEPGFQQLIATDVLAIVAGTLAAVRHLGMSDPVLELVQRTKAELEKQAHDVPVIEDLAELLNTSVSHLNKVFKAYTGLSPYEYHLQVKIQRAKEMLRNHELSIKQIALILGFQNQYHFSNLFKRKTGDSPRKWREAMNISAPEHP